MYCDFYPIQQFFMLWEEQYLNKKHVMILCEKNLNLFKIK